LSPPLHHSTVDICAEVFDPSFTRWTVFRLVDNFGFDFGHRKPEVLLRAWMPQSSIPDTDCLELDQYLKRLYGIQRYSGLNMRAEKHTVSLESSLERPTKRARITSDSPPSTPIKSTCPYHTPVSHISSSPGPLCHEDESRSYFRVAPTTRTLTKPSHRLVSKHLPVLSEEVSDSFPTTDEVVFDKVCHVSLWLLCCILLIRLFIIDCVASAFIINALHTCFNANFNKNWSDFSVFLLFLRSLSRSGEVQSTLQVNEGKCRFQSSLSNCNFC
jgi:hypothetical protein